ncbi:TRAP transporter small permease [Rhodobacteraceae bacterium RKSG542]|uniref:TRAP transporter small permease n=1 Tax=Pseudovibrio flavus TaxID=2529854 RepID=UPI0012BC9021|nr:TRAP transporter small permease [Pseudovibrio flavus]MTI17675.1 TRAP transporter small permease [Pseudovibrio flavus]
MLDYYYKLEVLALKTLLTACVGLVFVASLARWVGYPIIWSVDIAQLLFVWVCFLGSNQAMRYNQHIGVDFLVKKFPVKVQNLIEVLSYIIIIAFLLALVYYGTDLTLMNKERRLSDTDMSYAWVTAAVPVGCALLSVTSFVKLTESIRKFLGGSEGAAK